MAAPIAVNTMGLAAFVALYDTAFSLTQKKATRAIYLATLLSALSVAFSLASGDSPSSPFVSAALFTFAAALAASAFRLARPGSVISGATASVVLCYAALALYSSTYPSAAPHGALAEWYMVAHPALVVLAVPATVVYAAAALLGHKSEFGLLALWALSTAALFTGLYWAYREPDVTALYLADPLTGALAALWLSLSAAVVLREAEVALLAAAGAALVEVAAARAGLSLLHSVSRDPALAAVSLLPGLPLAVLAARRPTRERLSASFESTRAALRARDARTTSALALLSAALILLAPPLMELAGLARPGASHAAYASELTRGLLCLLGAAALAALWPALHPKAPTPLLLGAAAVSGIAAWQLLMPSFPVSRVVLSTFAAFTVALSASSLVARRRGRALALAVAALLLLTAPIACSAVVDRAVGGESIAPSVSVRPLEGALVVPSNSPEMSHTRFFCKLIANETMRQEFFNRTVERGYPSEMVSLINSTICKILERAVELGLRLEPPLANESLKLPRGLVIEVEAPEANLPRAKVVFDFESFLRGDSPFLTVEGLRAGRFPFTPVIGTATEPAGLGESVTMLRARRSVAHLIDALVTNYSNYARASDASLAAPAFIAFGYAVVVKGDPLATLPALAGLLTESLPDLSEEFEVYRFEVPLVNATWASAAALVASQVALVALSFRRALRAREEVAGSREERKKRKRGT